MGTQELIIIGVVLLLLFGGSQIPKLAKNLGKAQKEFKEGLAEGQGDKTPEQLAAERKADEVAAARKADEVAAARAEIPTPIAPPEPKPE